MDLRALGKNAKNPKGRAKANPKPAIPTVSWSAPPSAVSEPASNEPKIGPVQEKDTIAKVRAIKKIPNTPPLPEAASERFPQLLEAQSGKQLFSNTFRLIKDRNHFLLTTIQNPSTEFYLIDSDISAIQTPIRLSFINEKSFVRGNSNHLLLDKSKLKFPLTLRKWKQSDYFYPNGLKGSKKLSKYFKDEKYSLLEKEAQWILCSGEDIVWLIGKRADQRFLADIKTKEKWLIRYND
jgi:hypothetical protein